jgi:uncharacterized damage-inducible protein DinB
VVPFSEGGVTAIPASVKAPVPQRAAVWRDRATVQAKEPVMTRFVLVAVSMGFLGAPAQALAQAESPLTAAAKFQFDLTRGNIVKAAEKMPDDQYDFKPTPDVRSFGGVVAHVADANFMICSRAAGEDNPSKDSVEKTKTTKADLVKALNESFDYCAGAFAKMDDASGAVKTKFFGAEQPKLAVLWFNTVHNYEHYGNMVTYMRMKGLVPPSSERSGM